jgi:hypothetical protein
MSLKKHSKETSADYTTVTANTTYSIKPGGRIVLVAIVVEQEESAVFIEAKVGGSASSYAIKPKCDVKGRLVYNLILENGLDIVVTGVSSAFRAQVITKEMPDSQKDY